MSCAIADPAVGERFLMTVYLWDPVDERECDVYADHSDFEEDWRRELSSKHYYCSFYINQFSTQHSFPAALYYVKSDKNKNISKILRLKDFIDP